jgi:hypothetical protein
MPCHTGSPMANMVRSRIWLCLDRLVDASLRQPAIVGNKPNSALDRLRVPTNRLSWRNDRAALFRTGRLGLATQVEVAA